MESPSERMPIACVHCAKAKAKCDKKIPCSRCVTKQIVCQSRPTRRSSHNPNRHNQPLPRPHPARPLQNAGQFRVSQLSQFSTPPQEPPAMTSLNINSGQQNHHPIQPHTLNNISDMNNPIPIAPAIFGPEIDAQMLRNNYTQSPPDMTVPMTPIMPHMGHMDAFVAMNTTHFDHDQSNQYLASLSSGHTSLMDFDTSGMLHDLMSPDSMFHDTPDQYIMNGKLNVVQTPNQVTVHHGEGSSAFKPRFDTESPILQQQPHRPYAGPSPAESPSSGLQEPDAVLSSQHAWPFFQCNKADKFQFFPPKTAAIYLEGLAQTLRNQATWNAWTAQLDERSLEMSTERKINAAPMVSWCREKLLAITQGFLHKALDIHKAERHGMREDSPPSPDSSHDNFLMLPPPDVMQWFLRSYIVRYEPYYSSVAGGLLDPNALMHSSNSRAASLLILLMVASGATATATVEARYISSGLTEACRLSLFNIIEQDVAQARDVLVLRTALLFTCLAAWSGDKWHMDMAMGQRGMYMAMLTHGGLLDLSDSPRIDIDQCKREPERAWADWKEHEGKHRLSHSWMIVDQEISLFSDSTPLLSVVDLHTPMPDSDDLWHASSAREWLKLFEQVHGKSYHCPASVRDFFTKFVDGDLVGKELSPTQLRLLLHPLQAQVCQLRQFIACLPDGGSHGKASRAVSKAATKARLEEISALLQQWYTISKQSFLGNKGTCWTTCANLIMYHLVSLNAITSFKCIEQFARREVVLGSFRHASWLQMRCVDQPEETNFHCGQILRLIKSMPKPVRPPWWSGAVYRVALTGWANAMANGAARFSPGANNEPEKPFAIDDLTPEHEFISRYIEYQEGTPMLSRGDGTLARMDVPSNVLGHCIDVLNEDSSMRLADGIKRKLKVFMASWSDV